MRIKNVVNVMNFHSLLHVNSARREAEKYFESEVELTKLIDKIIYNRNIILDKKTLQPNPNKPILDIYIGNDMGFCGGFNTSLKSYLKKNKDNYKIIVGEKLYNTDNMVLVKMTEEEFISGFNRISDIIYGAIHDLEYREINVIYNHYHSMYNIETIKKTLFPVTFDSNELVNYNEDFVVETNIDEMLINLIALYICYEIRMAETNSWAAENVMRQKITNESLKKIDELELEEAKKQRKEINDKAFKKIIEIYRKG